jgi:hypothetical protein
MLRFEKGNGGKVLCSKRERKLIDIKGNICQSDHSYLKLGIDTDSNIVKMTINKKEYHACAFQDKNEELEF